MRIGKNLKLYSGVSRRYCLDVLKNMSEQRLRGNLLSLGLRWIAELAKLQLCISRLYVRTNAASSNKRLETPPPLVPTKINDDIIEMLFDRYNANRLALLQFIPEAEIKTEFVSEHLLNCSTST